MKRTSPTIFSLNLIKLILKNFPFNLNRTKKLKNRKLWAYFLRRLHKTDYKNLKVSMTGTERTWDVKDLIQLPNSHIFSCREMEKLKLSSIDSLECIGTYNEHTWSVTSLLCVGEFVLSGDSIGFIFLWRWDEMKVIDKKRVVTKGEVSKLIEVEKGIIASGQWYFEPDECSIKLWSIENYQLKDLQVELRQDGHRISCLLPIDAGKIILSGRFQSRMINVWDLSRKKFLFNLEGHTNIVTDLVHVTRKNENADFAEYVLSSSYDGTIKVWPVKDFMYIQSIEVGAEVACLCLLDAFTLASGDSQGNITIFDLSEIRNLKKLMSVKAHYSDVTRIIKLSDGRIASCAFNGTIKILE